MERIVQQKRNGQINKNKSKTISRDGGKVMLKTDIEEVRACIYMHTEKARRIK